MTESSILSDDDLYIAMLRLVIGVWEHLDKYSSGASVTIDDLTHFLKLSHTQHTNIVLIKLQQLNMIKVSFEPDDPLTVSLYPKTLEEIDRGNKDMPLFKTGL